MLPETQAALEWLAAHASEKDHANLARFGITATNPLGVSIANIQRLAKQLGRNHALAQDLWQTNCYEARLLTCFVADPAQLTVDEMERWTRQVDNWGLCDTLCFHLFDRSPHAWGRIAAWTDAPEEFVRRTAFALLASLALHQKQADDAPFLASLSWIEQAATDDRNFVKKGVSWALRAIGHRNPAMRAAATGLAQRLAQAKAPAARWVGRDALRDLNRKRE